ncbi:MAG: DUF5131 family protein [Desulfobacterales bacterium]
MSKIGWTDETWNPVTGCSPISEGCENCPAKRTAKGLRGRFGYPDDDPFAVTPKPDVLTRPLHWKRPRKVRVCSMGDIAHTDVPRDFFLDIWMMMRRCSQHTFTLLTRRPIGLLALIRWAKTAEARANGTDEEQETPSNIWVGISAENQKRFNERIPVLVQIPAAVKFVSLDPMIGPVSLTRRACLGCGKDVCDCPIESGLTFRDDRPGMQGLYWPMDRVICGVESDPKRRAAMSPGVADVKEQCRDAGIQFHPRGPEFGQDNSMKSC